MSSIFRTIRVTLNLFSGTVLRDDPVEVYERLQSRLQERIRAHQTLTGSIVKRRAELEKRLGRSQGDLEQLQSQLTECVAQGEDENALLLIEEEQELTQMIDTLELEYDSIEDEVNQAYQQLKELQQELERLRSDRDTTLATLQRHSINKLKDTEYDGLSLDEDMAALERVRDHAQSLKKSKSNRSSTHHQNNATERLAELKRSVSQSE